MKEQGFHLGCEDAYITTKSAVGEAGSQGFHKLVYLDLLTDTERGSSLFATGCYKTALRFAMIPHKIQVEKVLLNRNYENKTLANNQ